MEVQSVIMSMINFIVALFEIQTENPVIKAHFDNINTMCLYQVQDVNIKCGHAECQIIQTIRKLNRHVYRNAHSQHRQPSSAELQDGSELEDDLAGLVEDGDHSAPKAISSKRTIPSLTEMELVERVGALERELRELREVTLGMKRKLEQFGIL